MANRKRPIYNRIRQLDWLMWRMLSEHKCCMCAELLLEGYEPKKVNVTVHHLEGSIQTDDRTKPCPVDSQLFSHSSCHRAYHHMERMIERGHNVDKIRFRTMEKNIKKEVKRIRRSMK
jgi:hypothetical protein